MIIRNVVKFIQEIIYSYGFCNVSGGMYWRERVEGGDPLLENFTFDSALMVGTMSWMNHRTTLVTHGQQQGSFGGHPWVF
jgi:hypothetical protein